MSKNYPKDRPKLCSKNWLKNWLKNRPKNQVKKCLAKFTMATSLTVQNNITLSGSQTLSFGFLGHTYLLCANTSRSMVIWIKQLPCREEDAKDGMVYILCTDHQGNLLLGIVNWSGVACNVVQGPREFHASLNHFVML